MAFTNANFSLREGAPGDLKFFYQTTDTMAEVAAAGYFHNTTYLTNLSVGDQVYCQCVDGNVWLRVSAVSSGSVTTQFAGGNLPINTAATGTSDLISNLSAGWTDVGTSIATATRYILPTPYAGAEVRVWRVDSGTEAMVFDAGGSGATAITYDGSARRITLKARSEGFHVVGSSATRWRLMDLRTHDSAVSEGASVVFLGT